ncbi:MAG: TfoX/Sxy family protein [Myxococcales bacterium]|nr:TfoX/Sxy family protein [Myxococcales bacterium]
MSTELAWLKERLVDAAAGLRGVSVKRLFGCDALFRDDTIFALVWKTGRLGVKLRDESSYAELQRSEGAEPWSPMGKGGMRAWLLLPADWHEDDERLQTWVRKAHAEVSLATPAKKTPAKKTPAKKTPAKKTPAKKTPAKKKSR